MINCHTLHGINRSRDYLIMQLRSSHTLLDDVTESKGITNISVHIHMNCDYCMHSSQLITSKCITCPDVI